MNLAVSPFANIALSVLTSSLVSGGLFYWLTARKERSQFLRTKLEELFMAYQGYCKLITTKLYMPFMQVMAGKIDDDQAVDLVISTPEDKSRHHETCEMLILLYFEEFLPQWKELMECRGKLVSVHSLYDKAREKGEDTKRFIQSFDDAMTDFLKQQAVMRDAMIAKARKLMPPNRI